MCTVDKQDRFIELRAQGWTLSHIATDLGVSKRTLVEWNSHFAAEVKALRTMELELLQEKVAASREVELARLNRLQNDIGDELAGRGLKYIETEKLLRLSVDLRQEIERLLDPKGGPSEATALARAVVPATNGTPQR
jgi:transcriptional regulator with XRE-family HTH domain